MDLYEGYVAVHVLVATTSEAYFRPPKRSKPQRETEFCMHLVACSPTPVRILTTFTAEWNLQYDADCQLFFRTRGTRSRIHHHSHLGTTITE
jgi:hypothetical protein